MARSLVGALARVKADAAPLGRERAAFSRFA
jgi:hypothetical protein